MGANDYQLLKNLVDGVAADYEKASNGNRAAATRVRKSMMDVKAKAQEIRQGILTAPSATADKK